MNQPTTVITGATGFLGTAVLARLLAAGHRCHVISRDPNKALDRLPDGVSAAPWQAPLPQETRHLIHLAGDSVAGLWTRRKRAAILDSRTLTLETLSRQMRELPAPPLTLVSASAVGYYGHRPGEPLDETSLPDPSSRFRHQVCSAWEAAARAAVNGLPTRLVMLRYGNILDPSGGLLAVMNAAFRLARTVVHLGAPHAFKPWISLHDAADLTALVLTNNSIRGPLNATSPVPASSAELYGHLARYLNISRHVHLHPSLANLAMGELTRAFTEDQRVAPSNALAAGFAFAHPDLTTFFDTLHFPPAHRSFPPRE